MPKVHVTELPQTARRTGLTQMALALCPGSGHHPSPRCISHAAGAALAGAHDAPVKIEGKSFVHPTAILFNGGVFKADGPEDARCSTSSMAGSREGGRR